MHRIFLCATAATLFLISGQTAPAKDSPPPSAPAAPPGRETSSGPSAPPAEPQPAVKPLGGTRYEVNGIEFDSRTRTIRIPAKVNMTAGLLEYALVHESGKVHESLLSTTVSPFDLNVVLLLVHYQPGGTFFDMSNPAHGAVLVKDPKLPPAAALTATLEWKESPEKPVTARLESLLVNLDKGAPVTEGPFIYTGSFVTNGVFMAKDTGSILALYADAAALINNPREGNDNDDIWIPDQKKVPAKDTTVTLILAPPATEKPAASPPASGSKKTKPGSKSLPKRGSASRSKPSGAQSGAGPAGKNKNKKSRPQS